MPPTITDFIALANTPYKALDGPSGFYVHVRINKRVLLEWINRFIDARGLVHLVNLKVGSTDDIARRRREYRARCRDECIHWYYFILSFHHMRLEDLVHMALDFLGARTRMYPCFGCGQVHKEIASAWACRGPAGVELVIRICQAFMGETSHHQTLQRCQPKFHLHLCSANNPFRPAYKSSLNSPSGLITETKKTVAYQGITAPGIAPGWAQAAVTRKCEGLVVINRVMYFVSPQCTKLPKFKQVVLLSKQNSQSRPPNAIHPVRLPTPPRTVLTSFGSALVQLVDGFAAIVHHPTHPLMWIAFRFEYASLALANTCWLTVPPEIIPSAARWKHTSAPPFMPPPVTSGLSQFEISPSEILSAYIYMTILAVRPSNLLSTSIAVPPPLPLAQD
ncbi:hypothetical protein DFH09DRAFT_1111215 [Mycena vulgaris]|nr:hypothetical protein DFH09DRAFT_1111215 [Mycena vulgaris]